MRLHKRTTPNAKAIDRYNMAQKSVYGLSDADPSPVIYNELDHSYIRPNVINSMLFPETAPMGLGGRRGLQEEIQQANFFERQRYDDRAPDLSEMTGLYPGNYSPSSGAGYQMPRGAGRDTARAISGVLIKDALLRNAGIIGAGAGGIGLTSAVINAAQDDDNGNILINPVTGGVAASLGAGAGAYAVGNMMGSRPTFREARDIRRAEYGTTRDSMRAEAKPRSRGHKRGLQAGAATAGAVSLLNLISALRDE